MLLDMASAHVSDQRVVLLGSSHIAGMKGAILQQRPGLPIMSVYQRGAKIPRAWELFDQRFSGILRFSPTHVFLVIGHNSVCHHDFKNRFPMEAFAATDEIYKLVKHIQRRLPGVVVYYSAMFPRVPVGDFTDDQCGGYNRLVKRQTRYARSIGMNVVESTDLYLGKNPPTGLPECFSIRDGLHLSEHGQHIVALAWLAQLDGPGKGKLSIYPLHK